MTDFENSMEAFDNDLLDKMLSKITTAEQRRTDDKMNLAAAINDAMRRKGWKQKDLMEALGLSSPSLISKYLSGTHNFTVDTLSDIGRILEINLFNLNTEEKQTVLMISISTFMINIPTSATYYKEMPMAIDESGCLQYNL